MSTITVWFMDDAVCLEVKEFAKDAHMEIIDRAGEIAEKYRRPIMAYEVENLIAEVYPKEQMEVCGKCDYSWPYSQEGVVCPKCGHDNLPF